MVNFHFLSLTKETYSRGKVWDRENGYNYIRLAVVLEAIHNGEGSGQKRTFAYGGGV